MSRAARTLAALIAVLCCLAGTAVTPAVGHLRARADAATPPKRQTISISTLSPSYLRPGRPVRMTGTVFNDSGEPWGDVQVGMLASSVPFTSREDVAAASQVDPYQGFLGQQILDIGTFDDIGDIPPGESRSFSLTVPYEFLDLSGSEGVYHIGAEVRVTDGDGLRGSAARTLTFMPLVDEPAAAPVQLAVLWPLTAAVPWNGEEFVTDSLVKQFAEEGRLHFLAELGILATDMPLTWVLDPAVLDAARKMSDGFAVNGRELPPGSTAAQTARQWLDLVQDGVGNDVALAVPYAHPDIAALAHAGIRPGIRRAGRAGAQVLDQMRISRLGLLWPGNGRADQEVLDTAEQFNPHVALLARDTFTEQPESAVVELPTPGGNNTRDPETWPSLVVDEAFSKEGLRAQKAQTTLQWRQLVLANTALRSMFGSDEERTAIAMPTKRWWPDSAAAEADFFDGLRVPWINPVPVSDLTTQPAPEYDDGFAYPPAARRHELGRPILKLVRRVRRTSRTINGLLANPEQNRLETDKAFGLASSVAWRDDRQAGQQVAMDFLARNRTMTRSIDLEAPSIVTLSSDSGRFPISVTNGLDKPVTLQMQVTARDPGMTVQPIGPVTLQRDQRVTVTVVTNSRGVGITTLTARLFTQDGKAFGESATFQVRTTQIGVVVWVVMGIGAAVLFVAAARRIVTRVRRHRRVVRGVHR